MESAAWFIVTDPIGLTGRSLVTDFVPVVPESMPLVRLVESEAGPVGTDACTVESEAGPLVIDPVVSAVRLSLGTDLVESTALVDFVSPAR